MILPKNCNYYEIVLLSNDNKYDFGQSGFSKVLAKMSQTTYKHFEKNYKEYIIEDIIVHNYNNEETKVFRNSAKDVIENKDHIIIGFQKTKLTPLNYPSTTYIYNISYVKKLIFRISNRIYINFEINLDKDSYKTYKIYINYNHDNNVDMSQILSQLDELMKLLLE
jgi:hypothetical protein